ncbi:peptidoglycan DD-metalloendopeptidase family protein [Aureimonas fodinaquatilis]|uniref:Peptidoglycan DD-metalloendopeptidase family protein n=1 Tax=Aureimonas fodinaquatilis TaxID=2565783 RepID=A0A5B0DV47_9HYPH|nr:peptidoglycan DD-metalloendopeptidase family protein [Aureimonas fodinaquatilis]KAA0970687.1 peptidoglycan DD-metalloendopeptidase family protein [Aureimonas fodinaquatilis]
MAFGVIKKSRNSLLRAIGLLALTTALAACSSDVTRLQDGFYTGAIPQSSAPQPVQQPAYAASQPSYPAQSGAMYEPQQTSAQVSRSQLPPPSASPAQSTIASAPAQQPVYNAAPAQTPAPTQTAVAAASDGSTITVTPGDSLNLIASRAGVSVADLRAANGLASDNIRIGQVLQVPNGSGNTRVAALGSPPTTLQDQANRVAAPSAAPATGAAPAQTPAATQAAPAQTPAAPPAASSTVTQEAERETAALAPASTGIEQFRWPVQGRVVKNFGDKVGTRRNDGLDISVPRGTPVKAAENGVVIYAGEGLKEFGKTVLVKHDNGLVTVYGHADEILVERGATVRRGQDIAKAGMTGDTDAPMLHFEVRKDSSPVNPMTYLQ